VDAQWQGIWRKTGAYWPQLWPRRLGKRLSTGRSRIYTGRLCYAASKAVKAEKRSLSEAVLSARFWPRLCENSFGNCSVVRHHRFGYVLNRQVVLSITMNAL
jgi:hypothetical protein